MVDEENVDVPQVFAPDAREVLVVPLECGCTIGVMVAAPGGVRRLAVSRDVATGTARRPGRRSCPQWTDDRLTAQQVAIATLAAQARTNREIAKELFISPHTVNYHLRNIFEKLGIHSRVELPER